MFDPTRILTIHHTFFDFLTGHILILALSSTMMAFLISFRSYPIIIYMVRVKRLMDKPGERSSHNCEVPTLGGVGVFIAVSMTIGIIGSVLGLKFDSIELLPLLVALILLFFLGVKDDLLVLSPYKKLAGQLVAALVVILFADVRIDSFSGLFGINDLPLYVSILFTLFVFVSVINAFNLTDGVDGLAGSIAILSSVSFGIFFINCAQYFLVLISFSLVGAIIAFLRYNVSSVKRKIFMGDSGSLVIGFLLAFQAVSFLSLDQTMDAEFKIANPPIIALAILSFPLMDTLRVLIIRLKQKRSPFAADRNHLHHCMLDLGFTHLKVTLLVSLFCILIMLFAYSQRDLNIHLHFVVVLVLAILLILLPFAIAKGGR